MREKYVRFIEVYKLLNTICSCLFYHCNYDVNLYHILPFINVIYEIYIATHNKTVIIKLLQ